MVVITDSFASSGRNLGNKLFTYALGKIFSHELDLKLKIPPGSLIKRAGVNSNFPYGDIEGRSIIENSVYVSDHSLYNNGLIKTLEECRGKGVFLDGYFSKYDYIRGHKELIKQTYKDITLDNDKKNDVVIMLRDSGCDHNFKLPNEYYLDLLKTMTFENLYVCYDHYHKHTLLFKQLDYYSPKLIDYGIIDMFKFITSKNTIIACQGTFSFWASFLSQANKIYWPITKVGPNVVNEWSINLVINDEDRIEFININ